MRIFHLLNFQHVILYIFPTLIFVILLALSLEKSVFKTRKSELKQNEIQHRYPDNLREKNAPFPIIMLVTIAGSLLWAVSYVLLIGIGEVRY
jgi:hypothetical protein